MLPPPNGPLGKEVGDKLTFTDDWGRSFEVQIVATVANSILQGSLLIDESAFASKYPTEPGYRYFLAELSSERMKDFTSSMTRSLDNYGMALTPASQKLDTLNTIQNTYLSVFQLLGGLGLILGSAGLGIIVLRNIFERRAELALMLCTGFTRKAIQRFVLIEQGNLLLTALVIGIGASLVSIIPILASPARLVPITTLLLTLSGGSAERSLLHLVRSQMGAPRQLARLPSQRIKTAEVNGQIC